jgi:hypothetical protein
MIYALQNLTIGVLVVKRGGGGTFYTGIQGFGRPKPRYEAL